MRRFLPVLLVLAVAAACGEDAATDSATGSAPEPPGPDEAATGWTHDFVAETIDGAVFDAGDYEGQDLVLWFWAPW